LIPAWLVIFVNCTVIAGVDCASDSRVQFKGIIRTAIDNRAQKKSGAMRKIREGAHPGDVRSSVSDNCFPLANRA
jgi:hypothetical protein